MESYFEVNRISPWLFSLKDRLQVFSYLLVGDDGALLIDTGYGLGDLPAAVRSVTDKPLTVCASHGHVDHASGNFQFDEVFLHPADYEVCREHTGSEWRQKALDAIAEGKIDVPGLNAQEYLTRGTGKLVPLKTGRVFDLGGLLVEVIAMPGHTPGSVGFFVRQHRTLITGDAANRATFMFLPESTSLAAYGDMLEGVFELDFEKHYVGHLDKAFDRSFFKRYIKAARTATLENSKKMPVKGFEEIETYVRVVSGPIISPRACGVVFSPDKLAKTDREAKH